MDFERLFGVCENDNASKKQKKNIYIYIKKIDDVNPEILGSLDISGILTLRC